MRIGILEPDRFSPLALSRLAEMGTVTQWDGRDPDRFLADVEVLFVRLAHRIDAEFLARAPRLRVLCCPTTGHTHMDVDALARRGVVLLSLKGEVAFLESIRATPEHTLGLALALLRNYRGAFLNSANPCWDRDRYRGFEIYGLDVGLVGYGRVGRRVAAYLRAMDARVRWYDPFADNADDGRCETLGRLIADSRLVILAASQGLSPSPIIDADAIAQLAGRWFINTARGELVDEDALLGAVEQGQLAGCAVDVITDETSADNRLARWLAAADGPHNVIVTPHVAGATFRSMHATEEFLVDKLACLTRETP